MATHRPSGQHSLPFPVTGTALDKVMPRVGRVPAAGAALMISLGLASASYHLVERPVQRRRPAWTNPGSGRLPRQRPAGVPPAAASPVRTAADAR
ncbi:hypothetical protein [Frankia sp. AgB32]|uniref:hypothetical protein n=1 Tax=Frankia sp. AgB32 TaxID=631119 RepID=UPI00200E65AC|nr:hypothetical protein [Frankia sp. AgB32]MCK9895336.1 hypothetical protein [Frankia sp. AgB32]